MDVLYLIKKEGLRRGMSVRTISSYSYCVKQFMKYCEKEPRKVTKKDIREYLDYLIEKGACGNTLNVHLSGLKFFFEEILCRRLLLYIKYSKVPKTLPSVLTQEETLRLFGVIKNVKHRLMIELMYSAGLRLSELVNLRVGDLEFEKDYGWVRKGKGNKDRMFMVAERLKGRLIEYIRLQDLVCDDWLFKGRRGHVNKQTVYKIVKKAGKDAEIWKNVHPHTLRHSFATHLIENGCDVGSVQSLLGHGSMDTTMRYLHTAPSKMIKVKSPFDSLKDL